MQVEQVFDIRDAEHVAGTNRYVFKYPEHWRRIPNKQLTIGIRSIKLINYPLWLEWDWKCQVKDDQDEWATILDIGTNIQISPDESLSSTDKFRNAVREAYTMWYSGNPLTNLEFSIEIFVLEYNLNEQTLSFRLDKNTLTHKFYLSEEETTTPDFNRLVGVPDTFFPDFVQMQKQITVDKDGLIQIFPFYAWEYAYKKELSHIEIKYRPFNSTTIDPRAPYAFIFHNVPNRGNLEIKSSIPDLTNGQYLGYTNEKFEPIKYYQIHNSDSKFWIDLYDGSTGTPIELLPKDRIIIEAVVMNEPRLFK
jgi:hypothetical protein